MADIYNFQVEKQNKAQFKPGDVVRVEQNPSWGQWSGQEAVVVGLKSSRFGGFTLESPTLGKTVFDAAVLKLIKEKGLFSEVA